MAEKTTKKATAAKAAAPKATAEKKATKTAAKTTKTTTKKAAAKASVIYVNAENAGFSAGDVYQALATAGTPLSVAELAKLINKSERSVEDIYLGLGWLLKEGKVTSTEDNKLVLA